MQSPLHPDVAYWLEVAEARAMASLYRGCAALPSDPLGARVRGVGDGVAFALTAFDIGFFNRTVGLGAGSPATEADVDAVVRFYDDLARSVSVVQPGPDARPPALVDWLAGRGYAAGRRWAKLWHPLERLPEPATELRIEAVDAGRAPDFAAVVHAAFEFPAEVAALATSTMGSPGWTHYLGFDADRPVAAAALYVEDGVAWLGFGSTLEAYRGRGGQSAMFARRLRDAADAGCRFAVTETGEDTAEEPNPSYRNMRRAGFLDAYLRRNWVRQVSA